MYRSVFCAGNRWTKDAFFMRKKTKKWRVVKMQRIKLEIYLFITKHIADIELGLRFLDILSNLF